MTTTPNRIVPDVALVEVQQTAALQAVSAGLAVGDNGDWIDASVFIKAFMAGAPGDRAMTEEFNASQAAAMTAMSKNIPTWNPEMTLYWTNGAVDTFAGLTAPINLHDDVFLPALENDIVLPTRYSIGGETGDPVYTYSLAKIKGITPPDVTPGTNESAVFTVRMNSETRTPGVLA